MRTARALDPGTVQFNTSAGAYQSTLTSRWMPTSEIGVRFGVAHGVDLGFTLNALTVEGNATIQLVRSQYVDLALAPAFSLGASSNFDDEGVDITTAKLPLLVGINFGRHQLVLGPTVIAQWDNASGNLSADGIPAGNYHAILLGGTAAVSFSVSKSFRIMPLFGIFVPFGTGIPSMGATTPQITLLPTSLGNRPLIMQAGLGFSFGADGRGT
jgi:hypothetical protein